MCKKKKILTEYKNMEQEIEKVLSKLKATHEKSPYKVNNQTDNNSNVCFIFSCPGREELISEKLCNGATGDNLNELLMILKSKKPDIFQNTSKDQYDILNATSIVHFYALDHKTEGSKKEIFDNKKNLEEYYNKNTNLQYVILMGNKAKMVKDVFKGKSIIESQHLGYQSINQISQDINNKPINEDSYPEPKDRTTARLEVIAQNIIEQIR